MQRLVTNAFAVVCFCSMAALPSSGAEPDPPSKNQAPETRDVIITGEIRHHDALTIQRTGCSAITLGHCCSERPALKPLAARLKKELSGVTVGVSTADASPFVAV